MIEKVALFGASGDLAGRYLLPALASLLAAGRLPRGFGLVGAGRTAWDDAEFRLHVMERLEEHAAHLPLVAREQLVAALRYRRVDFDDPDSLVSVVRESSGPGGDPVAAYLALPPGAYATVVAALGSTGLPSGSRIVVEKPYGEDLESTVKLDAMLARRFGDDRKGTVYRVDHALGMATVQNLLGLRFANSIMELVWNGRCIEQVDILWEETLALENRAGFYDRAGALKDVIENHLLQVLCMVGMEPPDRLDNQAIHDRKIDLLRSVRPITPGEMASRTRRARYTAGRIGDRAVPAYVDEKGVDPERRTETFAEVVLEVATPRWEGTGFVLRTAKALGRDRQEVVLHFRPVRHPLFDREGAPSIPGELTIGLDSPRDLVLRLAGSTAGSPPFLVPLTLTGPPPASDLAPYDRVLLDILSGTSDLSLKADEAEEEWRIMTPVLQAWANDEVPLLEYPAGSEGPFSQGATAVHGAS